MPRSRQARRGGEADWLQYMASKQDWLNDGGTPPLPPDAPQRHVRRLLGGLDPQTIAKRILENIDHPEGLKPRLGAKRTTLRITAAARFYVDGLFEALRGDGLTASERFKIHTRIRKLLLECLWALHPIPEFQSLGRETESDEDGSEMVKPRRDPTHLTPLQLADCARQMEVG